MIAVACDLYESFGRVRNSRRHGGLDPPGILKVNGSHREVGEYWQGVEGHETQFSLTRRLRFAGLAGYYYNPPITIIG